MPGLRVFRQLQHGPDPEHRTALQGQPVLQTEVAASLAEGGSQRFWGELLAEGLLLVLIGDGAAQMAEAGLRGVAEHHPVQVAVLAPDIQNTVGGQVQPGGNHGAPGVLGITGGQLPEPLRGGFLLGDILGLAHQAVYVSLGVKQADPGDPVPSPALAVIAAPVFQRLRDGAEGGPADGGDDGPAVIRVDGPGSFQMLQIVGNVLRSPAAGGVIPLQMGGAGHRVIVQTDGPGAVQQQVTQLALGLKAGFQLPLLGPVGEREIEEVAAFLPQPGALRRQPLHVAVLTPDPADQGGQAAGRPALGGCGGQLGQVLRHHAAGQLLCDLDGEEVIRAAQKTGQVPAQIEGIGQYIALPRLKQNAASRQLAKQLAEL